MQYLESIGCKCIPVESLTGYPSVFGGRVKTLHPKIFGGILFRRDYEEDAREAHSMDIKGIDLVITDLYPFEDALASGAGEADLIEKIDIGGISLIRAAAKNFKDVLVIPSRDHYGKLSVILDNGGVSSVDDRRILAGEAFQRSASYDACISRYFCPDTTGELMGNYPGKPVPLRYGENPHQKGMFYGDPLDEFEILGGRELSYNNLVDIESAMNLLSEFEQRGFVIIKHTNACGAALGDTALDAWQKALSVNPLSAFGGILATNGGIDMDVAEELNRIFFEVLIAPSFEKSALEMLKAKKNRIILRSKKVEVPGVQFRSLLNGILWQESDRKTESQTDLKYVTELKPDAALIRDLLFANCLVKHLKSNAIVLVKDGQMMGCGNGQTSRVHALKQAISGAEEFGHKTEGAVMASDAFFPFSDCVEIAAGAGIKAIIQPGGSIRDQEYVDACNRLGLAMVFTGIRHFKH